MELEAGPRLETELLKPSYQDALRTRLLIGGEAINPDLELNKELTPDELQLDDVLKHEAVSTMISNASIYERSSTTDSVDEWKSKMVSYITQFSPTNEQDTEQMQKAEFLTKLGYDPRSFDVTAADSLYKEYFSADIKDKSANKFINKVLRMYNKDDGSVDLQKIKSDEKMIKSLAGIFGSNCSNLISEKIQAMAEAKTDPISFLAKANNQVDNIRVVDAIVKDKDLSDDQKSLEYKRLKFLWEHGKPIIITAQPAVEEQLVAAVQPVVEAPEEPVVQPPPTVQEVSVVTQEVPPASPAAPPEIPPGQPPVADTPPVETQPVQPPVTTPEPQIQAKQLGAFERMLQGIRRRRAQRNAEAKRIEEERQHQAALGQQTPTPTPPSETTLDNPDTTTNPIAPHPAADADVDSPNREAMGDTGGTVGDISQDPDQGYSEKS